MVSDISEKILEITAEHPTVKSLVIHTGALYVVKQQSEVLKQDFNDLLNKVRCLNTEVFISGPLPTVRRGDEGFSRLLMLNRWLKDTCAAQSVNFIDNFNIFWERRHLFEADGFCLNKSGVQLLSYNIFYFLHQSPAAPAKDKRRDNTKQQIRQPSGEKLLPPEIRINHEGQHTEREALTSSSLPQHKEFPPSPNSPTWGVSPSPNNPTGGVSPSPNSPTWGVSPSPNNPTGGVSPSPNSPTSGVSPSPTRRLPTFTHWDPIQPFILSTQSGFPIPPFSGFHRQDEWPCQCWNPTHTTPKSHFFSPKSPSSSSPPPPLTQVICESDWYVPGPGCNTDTNNVLPQEKSGPYGVQVAFSIPVMTGNKIMVKLVRTKSVNLPIY